jgi:hypothetical protein
MNKNFDCRGYAADAANHTVTQRRSPLQFFYEPGNYVMERDTSVSFLGGQSLSLRIKTETL